MAVLSRKYNPGFLTDDELVASFCVRTAEFDLLMEVLRECTASSGEFWLECLTHLAAQAPRREDDPDLQRTATELRAVRDDQALADRCLAALLDFADRHDTRLLLVVENLNALLRHRCSDKGLRRCERGVDAVGT